MHIELETSLVIALAIYAHAWIGRLQGKPQLLNIIAWVVVIITMVVLLLCLVR